jgi:quercetin dioxygenase-like cupin family protein
VRLRRIPLVLGAVLVLGTGVAVASHVTQVDPATVPTGFLAAHNRVGEFPVGPFARAAAADGAEVYVQHARIPAGGSTIWHSHPGPVIVTVVGGSLTFEDAHAGECRRRTYQAGTGFVDPGYGHVHRAVAGASTLDFYAVYVLPPGSPNHLIAADAPEECV